MGRSSWFCLIQMDFHFDSLRRLYGKHSDASIMDQFFLVRTPGLAYMAEILGMGFLESDSLMLGSRTMIWPRAHLEDKYEIKWERS